MSTDKIENAGRLSELNNLKKQSSGVMMRGRPDDFGYSDGEESESYLTDTLTNATDLSSGSAELESKVKDWPSEYHLSAKRANILRHLDLDPGLRVLELGCGCGAITRYMGEQGHSVDAIEGSLKRAEIAALRCRDLNNIDIICANFNELDIPHDSYDVVLLIGVAEYAARFWPETIEDEDAVVRLLGAARMAIRPHGMVIVAIENRTGMKYVMGAHEDHYSQRYVGVHNYPDSNGMRTYTRGEWEHLIERSGFSSSKYMLPFPDYKVPTVLLSEAYSVNQPYAYAHIEGTRSRDYRMLLDLGEQEAVFWEAAVANKTLPEFANSYLILIGDSLAELERVARDDFVHLPDFGRKNVYSVITRKRSGSNVVERQRVVNDGYPQESFLAQQVKDEAYIEGVLLSIEWSRSLLIEPWGLRFKAYLSEYFDYLEAAELHIDLVPTNIIVAEHGEYRPFDDEWVISPKLDRDYIYFRALMLFALRHGPSITEFARWHSIFTVREFILFGFEVVKPGATPDLAPYIALENSFQKAISRSVEHDPVSDSLNSRICYLGIAWPISAKLYWCTADEPYDEQRSIVVQSFPEEEDATLIFEIPVEVAGISRIRFDPCDERATEDVGFMQISYCRIDALVRDQRVELMTAKGSEQIAAAGKLSGIVYHREKYGEVFAVVGDNPEIEFELTGMEPEGEVNGYRIEIVCTHIRSPEYRLVKERFLIQEETLRKQIGELRANRSQLQAEIDGIRSSKAWKVVELCRSFREHLGK